MNQLETNSRNKNIRDLCRGINEFQRGCQPRTNLVKDENGVLFLDSLSTSNRRKNYFCQLLNVHGVNDVRQTEMHTPEPFIPEPNCFRVETDTEKLKRYESPCTD
jgi:hypothetical protein